MKRNMGVVAAAAALVVAVEAGETSAQPSPVLSTIPNVLVVPGGSLTYSVTIRSVLGAPMPFIPSRWSGRPRRWR